MLPAVMRNRRLLAPGDGWQSFSEVPGPNGGIVDLVWVRFARGSLAERDGGAPILDLTALRCVIAIGSGVASSDLPQHTGVSRAHLSRAVLPRLVGAGWIAREGASWVPVRRFRAAATRLVTVELKRDNWRGALRQAARHSTAADASWVVLDARRAAAARRATPAFRHASTGLAALALRCPACISDQPELEVLQPPTYSAIKDRVAHAFLGEQCLELLNSGADSGPARPVFGRLLIPAG
ncbi:MAG: transcriptional regulator, BadM/Rrf2 family [Streptosporangiaceae bacterium]|nr:transcriptional regulator, BadM/Rrf2 family [Streptosporangiaceae bacterium]